MWTLLGVNGGTVQPALHGSTPGDLWGISSQRKECLWVRPPACCTKQLAHLAERLPDLDCFLGTPLAAPLAQPAHIRPSPMAHSDSAPSGL
ncbi:hypothetical protein AAFF_G00380630 [Aldrovandia affinis]|uniref:Uncharacterized protein n=1 Tax=Aldrovandia affinis TaxID=143900 RepID=A0AAD7T7U1_9TELE|nr:hypothetical protein AAFF_G00380630 [Aldrovandia affinis]